MGKVSKWWLWDYWEASNVPLCMHVKTNLRPSDPGCRNSWSVYDALWHFPGNVISGGATEIKEDDNCVDPKTVSWSWDDCS